MSKHERVQRLTISIPEEEENGARGDGGSRGGTGEVMARIDKEYVESDEEKAFEGYQDENLLSPGGLSGLEEDANSEIRKLELSPSEISSATNIQRVGFENTNSEYTASQQTYLKKTSFMESSSLAGDSEMKRFEDGIESAECGGSGAGEVMMRLIPTESDLGVLSPVRG